jgi:hypothetical protein
MNTEYVRIMSANPEILRWKNRQILYVVIKKENIPRRTDPKQQRLFKTERKIYRSREVEAIIKNYMFGLKKRLFLLQYSTRILQ